MAYKRDNKKKTHDKNRKIYLEKVRKFRNTHKLISNPSDKSHAVIVKRDKPLANKASKTAKRGASKMLKRFKKD